MQQFDEAFDVVVVGYGFAGGTAAIESHDAGADVLIIEKMPDAGGISMVSGGAVRCAESAADAFGYLKATCGGRTPDDVVRTLADGMATAHDYVKNLASQVDATLAESMSTAKRGGNYPFPGWQTFYSVKIDEIPGFDRKVVYPHVRCRQSFMGPKLFRVVELNVAKRGIEFRLNTAARRLITDGSGGVIGIEVQGPDGPRSIQARHGVVLACGGFENDPEMQRQYWQGKPVLTAASRGNTGDGIRMAQAVGADLWHMWHYHGSYAFRHPDDDFPFALRTKRLPDWNPLHKDTLDIKLAWIVVDQRGRRYMNEWPPYTQDTGWRPMELFDPETQTFPRIPSYLIADEACRRLYPLGDSTSNDRDYFYDWSEDNTKEIELGILHQADTIAALAAKMEVDPRVLEQTIARWNEMCTKGDDSDFGRPKGTLQPIVEPPFIFGEVWPTVSNTQGGPVHDSRQRVLNSFGEPIPGLYAAGELGSAFGHLYLSGSNLTECFVSGRIAGREAARLRND